MINFEFRVSDFEFLYIMWLIIKQNRSFIIPYLFFLLISLFFLFSYSRSEIHIFINNYHNKTADIAFQVFSFLGTGYITALFVIIYLFIRYRYAIVLAASGIAVAIIVRIFKLLIFPDLQRPVSYFKGVYDLYLVEGVKVHSYYSFPSGHTATAFVLFMILAVFVEKKWLKFIFCILALLTGYSRMYLSQHFLVDVVGGSVIGVIVAVMTIYLVNLYKKNWMEGSIKLKIKN